MKSFQYFQSHKILFYAHNFVLMEIKNGLLKWLCTGSCVVGILLFSCNMKKQKEASQKNLQELGRYLFFDNRLSFNQTKSCSSCHDPKFAFSDGYRKSITASGDIADHNSPSLINCVNQSYFDWANPQVTSLEQQADRPLFNLHPIELGAKGMEEKILKRLKADSFYSKEFVKNFKEKDPVIFTNIKKALAAFTSSLISYNSPYDNYINGDTSALSPDAKKGMELFLSDKLKCARCHEPPSFFMNNKSIDSFYANIGLYNIGNTSSYPSGDPGLKKITGKNTDDGKFKIPGLRNVALTTPYTHDGSVNSLDEMINIYAAGGRNIYLHGPADGDGRTNANKSKLITGFLITNEEKKQLIDFLYALTDSSVLSNPSFQNPFLQKRN